MRSKITGLLNKLVLKIKFGRNISFNGIPSFISRAPIYIKSGKVMIGENFSMKQYSYMASINGGKIRIGDNVSINRNCILVCHDTISIGDNCAIGPNTTFYDHDHNFGDNGIENGFKKSPIIVGNNCWIGAGVTILRGTQIGDGSVIGAGTVVRGNIPPHSLVTANRELNIVPITRKKEDN